MCIIYRRQIKCKSSALLKAGNAVFEISVFTYMEWLLLKKCPLKHKDSSINPLPLTIFWQHSAWKDNTHVNIVFCYQQIPW